jgi:5S rRNA maturation endonuclease (ribonuclease M5)
MDKAVERIRRAIEDYEQILIYGDYDADGMTSASILKETLEEMGRSPSLSSQSFHRWLGRISQFTSILSSSRGFLLL